eukprot:4431740-Pyramimonas_sp.AAC.1
MLLVLTDAEGGRRLGWGMRAGSGQRVSFRHEVANKNVPWFILWLTARGLSHGPAMPHAAHSARIQQGPAPTIARTTW